MFIKYNVEQGRFNNEELIKLASYRVGEKIVSLIDHFKKRSFIGDIRYVINYFLLLILEFNNK